jgi:hypothetical protein
MPRRSVKQFPIAETGSRTVGPLKWKEQLNGDCPKRDAHSMLERCDLICPVMKVVRDRSRRELT